MTAISTIRQQSERDGVSRRVELEFATDDRHVGFPFVPWRDHERFFLLHEPAGQAGRPPTRRTVFLVPTR